MKILVSETIETIFHCHNWVKEGWTEGKFGKSLTFMENSVYIKSDKFFEDTYKVYQISKDHYIVTVDGLGYEAKTVKEAVEKTLSQIGRSNCSFEFSIEKEW